MCTISRPFLPCPAPGRAGSWRDAADAAGGQPAEARRRSAWRWLPAAVLAACVAVLIGVAVFALARDAAFVGRTNPATENAYVGGDVIRLSARVQGDIRTLPVDDNQVVHRGDLIAVLDDVDCRARRDQAWANLEAARARLDAVGEQERQLLVQIDALQGFALAAMSIAGSRIARRRAW